MRLFEMVVLALALLGVGLGVYGLTYKAPVVNQKNNLVCFDMSKNLRLNLIEYNIRFDSNVIRFTNGEGEYAVYPPDGWLCSIVRAE